MKENTLWKELMGSGRDSGDPVLEALYKGNQSAYGAIKNLVLGKNILPFIGAGFSAGVYPTWNKFLIDTAAAYPACKKEVRECIDQGQYEEAAEKLCAEMTRFSFRNQISQTFGKDTLVEKFSQISSDRKKLNEIFPCNVITTNYDRVLETIYRHEMEAVCPHTEYQKPLLDKILHSNQPSLIKLHGDIEDISHIVITRSDYEKVYGSSAMEDAPDMLVLALKQILQSRTVLFLGCSLYSDRTMQVLLDSAGETRQYYALAELPKETENPEDPFSPFLVDKDGSENPAYRERRQFMGNHHINCIWYPYGKHAALDALLRKLYEEACPAPIPARSGKGSFEAKREIVGRDDAIKELSDIFLTQNKILFVTGTGGIGKTELCRSVIACHPDFTIPYIELFGVNSLEAFCAKVAAAIGYGDLPETNDIDKNWNLLAGMILDEANGHYGLYLDNWEDLWIGLAESEKKRIKLLGWLEGLVSRGIKVMVSSREQPRKYNFRIYIYPVAPLDSGKGYDDQLFSRTYREKGGKLEPEGREYGDILKKLGGHPLSIVLAATFASAKTSWKSVLDTWIHAGMWGENERHNSLRTALGISWESLLEEPLCMDTWGVLALCIDNPKIKFIAGVLQCSQEECERVLTVLYDSSIINWGGLEEVVMLPPVKEVFFQLASQEQIERVLKRYGIWMGDLIEKTSLASKDRDTWHSQLIDMLSQIYYVMEKMIDLDLLSGMIVRLCYGLGNYFQFCNVQSLGILKKCLVFAREKEQYDFTAFVLLKSGDLKRRLGEVDAAMELYGEAEGLYRVERDNLGLANVLKNMGKLKSRLGEVDAAMGLYGEAESLYRDERSKLGLANVLTSMGELKNRLGEVDAAMGLYGEAESLYRDERSKLGLANVLTSMGELKNRLGEVDAAMGLYGEAESLYRDERSKLGLANVLTSMGELKNRLGEVDAAMGLYVEAEGLYRDERSNLGLANVLKSKGDLKSRLGEVDAAMGLYGEAESLYRDERDNLGLANVLKSKGKLKSRLGEVDAAMELYGEAESLYRAERSNLGLANVLKSKGDLKSRLGEVDAAVGLYGEAESLHRVERDNLGLANVLQSKGDLKRRLGEVDAAMELYGEAESLYRAERSNLGLANVLQSKGDLKRHLGEVDAAMGLYGEAESLYRVERSNLGLANVLQSKGDLKRRLGEVDAAMELYGEAESLYRAERSNLGLANVLQSKGDLKRRLGEVDAAMELYGEAGDLYRVERFHLGLANILQGLGDIFLEQGKLHEAAESYEYALLLYKNEKEITGYAYTMSELCLAYSLCNEREKASKIIAELNEIFDKIPYEDAKSYITGRIQKANDILKKFP